MSTEGDTDAVSDSAHYRSYEVYQRERVGQTTNLIRPRQLIGDDFRDDPYPLLSILRENYPCFRDWVSNRFWITRYDDVTSVLADTANYAVRPRRSSYPTDLVGRSLWNELDITFAVQRRIDAASDRIAARVVDAVRRESDLAVGLATGTVVHAMSEVLGVDDATALEIWTTTWAAQQGAGWEPAAIVRGRHALVDLATLFDRLLGERRGGDGDDMISVAARMVVDGSAVTGRDMATTMLEADLETLHGGLANMWFHLLTQRRQLAQVIDEPRLMKFAWLETLRHSAPVLGAPRWARHEVERFGRLIPEGALVFCSAAAANRDPRAFTDPDTFDILRSDLCQREPRGQYRADGLPSGISIGTGLPSRWPAEPRERPRSAYALVRDLAVRVSLELTAAEPHLQLADGHTPVLRSHRLGEMHTCHRLQVAL